MANAYLTPQQLAEILGTLDRIVGSVESAQKQVRVSNSTRKATLLSSLETVGLEALSVRQQIIQIMADRVRNPAAARRVARSGSRSPKFRKLTSRS